MSNDTLSGYTVGVRGYNGSSAAEYLEDVTAGLHCLWLELPGGARVDGLHLTAVRFECENDTEDDYAGPHRTVIEFVGGSAFTKIELEAIGPLKIVYCDRDGKPLPSREDIE